MSFIDNIVGSETETMDETSFSRELDWESYFFGNITADDDFTSKLEPASDVSVDAVMTSVYLNLAVFVVLMGTYEILRRLYPSVYAARKQCHRSASAIPADTRVSTSDSIDLPDSSGLPLTWVGPVFGVSWSRVRKVAGLDGYFFLRYIRMCLRITLVSTFWSALILVPVFATGDNGAEGWYHISMTNIQTGTWRIWVPVTFIYLFSGFCCFVMKQEYRHFMELRMDFLGKGDRKVHPQHHYSLAVENIPIELRSDRALFDYFNSLFPGKIHSASVVLNLPDLEAAATRRKRILCRLEKSIATFHATGVRPSHVTGRSRMTCCGIHLAPCDCDRNTEVVTVDMNGDLPPKGTRVDSISYYTRELADSNQEVFMLQKRKTEVVESGNVSTRAFDWLSKMADFATMAATAIMQDSAQDNALSPNDSLMFNEPEIPQAERMTSMYGSFGKSVFSVPSNDPLDPKHVEEEKKSSPVCAEKTCLPIQHLPTLSEDSDDKNRPLMEDAQTIQQRRTSDEEFETRFVAPGGGREKERGFFRRIAGRLGLDFLVAGLRYLNRQMDVVVESVVGSTMSSTGFVTFLDLASVTCAASTPLTNKPNVLIVKVAPEPRDIRWESAHIDTRVASQRTQTANLLLFLGIILWSFPLAAIQAFATADQLARIPGMQWILTINGGSLSSFINGYLPVLALLGLILILPVLFEWIAVKYEARKTYSDVQRSILERYFYYQLANIYVTVTAGSLWSSLAEIIEKPSNVLELLGESLPTVVGYFVALLVTKILAGLPTVFLRVGALGRMIFLRSCFPEKKLTQRELDEVYRPENIMYGWEYPTQLLVIVICFTYACICPVILPFGAVFFAFALVVYKKQLLYVYTPVYESGGSFFPDVCRRTLLGLICGQLTFMGYIIIRGYYYMPLVLIPLPVFTLMIMRYFRLHYAEPSKQLSMERAMECDRVSDVRTCHAKGVSFASGLGIAERREQFNRNAYRQPVLAARAMEPMNYRLGQPDALTEEANLELHRVNRYVYMTDDEANEGDAYHIT